MESELSRQGANDNTDPNDLRDLLLAVGGLALMVVGAGLVASHPMVRRYVGELGLNEQRAELAAAFATGGDADHRVGGDRFQSQRGAGTHTRFDKG